MSLKEVRSIVASDRGLEVGGSKSVRCVLCVKEILRASRPGLF